MFAMATGANTTGVTTSSAWYTSAMVPEAALNSDVPTLIDDLKGISTKGPLTCSKIQVHPDVYLQK